MAGARRWLVPLVAAALVGVGGGALAADGDLDPSFDGDGRVVTPFPGGAYARAVAVQADGKVVVVGAAAGDSGTGEFAVARYEADGSLDGAFGSGGLVTTPVGDGGDDAFGVAIQDDGAVVVVGTAGRERFAVVRYTEGGALDPTFGGDGIVRTDFGPGVDVAADGALQPNGRIVVVGESGTHRPRFALARYRPDGALDRRFGTGGRVVTPFGIWGVAHAVALQPNGHIVVVGGDGGGFALARYDRHGDLDPTFGGDGKVSSTFLLGDAGDVALQDDGRIVAVGAYDFWRFAVARYTRRGRLDPTFSHNGWLTKDVGRGFEQGATAALIQRDGRIVVAGHAGPHEVVDPTPWRFVVLRYRPSGALDPTFGGDGKVVTAFAGGAFARGGVLQDDGKVVLVGGQGDGNSDAFAVTRYLA